MSKKPRRPLREWEFLLALRGEVERCGSLRKAATSLGVSPGYLSRVLRGEKPIADTLALALGYERQQLFVPYEERGMTQEGSPAHEAEGVSVDKTDALSDSLAIEAAQANTKTDAFCQSAVAPPSGPDTYESRSPDGDGPDMRSHPSALMSGASSRETGTVPVVDSASRVARRDGSNPSDSLQNQAAGGSDTARLQRLHLDALRALTCLYLAADEHVIDDVNAKVKAALDAQALALRSAQQERDDAEHELTVLHNTCGRYEENATRLRAGREIWGNALRECDSLRADVARLTAQLDVQPKYAANARQYLKRAERAEQQLVSLQAGMETLIQKWEQETRGYVSGALLTTPIGDMNRASAETVRRMLNDLVALLAAITEP